MSSGILVRRSLACASFLLFAFAVQPELRAQAEFESLGVQLNPGGWNATDHADDTYIALKTIQGQLATYDFYYQLVIYPHYKFTFSDCNQTPTIDAFLRRFVGITSSNLLTINATIRHRGEQGPTELMADQPIIIVGRGITNNAGDEGNGCFFDQSLSNTTPLIRYSAKKPGEEDFEFKFRIAHTTNVTANFVTRVKSLFSIISGYFSFTDLTGERVKIFTDAANELQTAFNDSSKIANTNNVPTVMPLEGVSTSRYKISMPTIISTGAGYFAFYVKLTASQVLAKNSTVTPGLILANQTLGFKTCYPKPGAKLADCAPDRKTFRDFMISVDATMPVRFFDLRTAESRKKVYGTCDQLRIRSTETLALSTIDALLVRWAAIKEGKLYDVLQGLNSADPTRKKALKDLATENQVSSKALVDMCWHPDDQRKLAGVVKAVTGRDLN